MTIFKYIKTLVISLFITTSIFASESATIEKYNEQRDSTAIIKILNDTPQYLRYEFLGCPSGTTEKYITSPSYITEVVRVDGKTAGFINYIAHNSTLLTFHLMRRGTIHLMGVDTEYQGKGYGKLLLNHAIEQLTILKVPKISLNTKLDNIKAQSIYEKAGFKGMAAGTEVYYTKEIDIPADQLPQGNIIQRNPKISALIAATGISSYLWWKHIAK